jgi:hypothetical protein
MSQVAMVGPLACAPRPKDISPCMRKPKPHFQEYRFSANIWAYLEYSSWLAAGGKGPCATWPMQRHSLVIR